MIQLSSSTQTIKSLVESILTGAASRQSRAVTLFLLVDAIHGNIQVYLSSVECIVPYEELVGNPIDEVIDIPEWMEEWKRMMAGESGTGLVLADNSTVACKTEEDFNVIFSKHVHQAVLSLVPRLDASILPNVIVIESDAGFFSERLRLSQI